MFQGDGGYGVGGFGGGGRGGGRYNDDQTDINSEHFRQLFVYDLNYETDEKSLKSYFEQWGEIDYCVVMRNLITKRSRGFGFITYSESFMVDEAQKNRPHKIDNREVETKRAMPKNADGTSNHQSVKRMFVSGLKDDTTEEQMRDVFGQFGEIDSIDMFFDKTTGRCRAFAFVTYKDYDSVDRAVLLKRHNLNTRRVKVEKAVSKDKLDGSGRGGVSAGWGRCRVVDSFSGGLCGYSPYRPFGGGYGGCGYAGLNWRGSDGYGNYNSSLGGGFGSTYGRGYVSGPVKYGCGGPVKDVNGGPVKGSGGGPVKGSADVQLEAGDLMEMAVDKLAVAAEAAMMVVDSDNKVVTEAAECPEHMDIQIRPRKRKHEKTLDNVVEQEAED